MMLNRPNLEKIININTLLAPIGTTVPTFHLAFIRNTIALLVAASIVFWKVGNINTRVV